MICVTFGAAFTEICSNSASVSLLLPILFDLSEQLCLHPLYTTLPGKIEIFNLNILTDTGPKKSWPEDCVSLSWTFRFAPLSTPLLIFRQIFERENSHGPLKRQGF